MAVNPTIITDTDYRFAIALSLIVLMAVLFITVMYFTNGNVELAILAAVTPFIGLIQQIVVAYFDTKKV